MQIVELNEPNKLQSNEEIVVGIDFGTTNSLIAYAKNGQPVIIQNIGNDGLLASKLVLDKTSNEFVVNNRNEYHDSARVLTSIKRLFGKSISEVQNVQILQGKNQNFQLIQDNSVIKVKSGDKEWLLPELAAKIFSSLKIAAELELGASVNKAVVSVPAYFDNNARGMVLLSARLAGIEVIRLIAEPTAAAYAYGFHKKPEGTYMVYDLGGGTFDVSILNMQDGILQVIATGGDNLLGGDDIDQFLAEYISRKFDIEFSPELINIACSLKKSLSLKENRPAEDVHSRLNNKEIRINYSTYIEIIKPLISKTIKIAQSTVFDSESALDGVILVGGSTRIPEIRSELIKHFAVPVYSDINADTAVVIGAALQAEALSTSNNGSLLIDVLPLSLGIELYGGLVEKIIMRNTPIPFSVTKNFTTQADNQTGIKFHVVQGERELAKDCRSLAQFELTGIPAMKAGRAKIELTFAIDADGILSVTARDSVTGMAADVAVKPSYDLDGAKVNDLLESAFKNAALDHQQRLLTEAKINAENIVFNINKALNETPDILDSNEKIKLIAAINSLQKVINSDNREIILAEIDQLNKLAADFIEKHINLGVELLLKGKRIEDI